MPALDVCGVAVRDAGVAVVLTSANCAKLGIVQTRRGIVPDLRSHWTRVRAVGHAVAADLLLTGVCSGARKPSRLG